MMTHEPDLADLRSSLPPELRARAFSILEATDEEDRDRVAHLMIHAGDQGVAETALDLIAEGDPLAEIYRVLGLDIPFDPFEDEPPLASAAVH